MVHNVYYKNPISFARSVSETGSCIFYDTVCRSVSQEEEGESSALPEDEELGEGVPSQSNRTEDAAVVATAALHLREDSCVALSSGNTHSGDRYERFRTGNAPVPIEASAILDTSSKLSRTKKGAGGDANAPSPTWSKTTTSVSEDFVADGSGTNPKGATSPQPAGPSTKPNVAAGNRQQTIVTRELLDGAATRRKYCCCIKCNSDNKASLPHMFECSLGTDDKSFPWSRKAAQHDISEDPIPPTSQGYSATCELEGIPFTSTEETLSFKAAETLIVDDAVGPSCISNTPQNEHQVIKSETDSQSLLPAECVTDDNLYWKVKGGSSTKDFSAEVDGPWHDQQHDIMELTSKNGDNIHRVVLIEGIRSIMGESSPPDDDYTSFSSKELSSWLSLANLNLAKQPSNPETPSIHVSLNESAPRSSSNADKTERNPSSQYLTLPLNTPHALSVSELNKAILGEGQQSISTDSAGFSVSSIGSPRLSSSEDLSEGCSSSSPSTENASCDIGLEANATDFHFQTAPTVSETTGETTGAGVQFPELIRRELHNLQTDSINHDESVSGDGEGQIGHHTSVPSHDVVMLRHQQASMSSNSRSSVEEVPSRACKSSKNGDSEGHNDDCTVHSPRCDFDKENRNVLISNAKVPEDNAGLKSDCTVPSAPSTSRKDGQQHNVTGKNDVNNGCKHFTTNCLQEEANQLDVSSGVCSLSPLLEAKDLDGVGIASTNLDYNLPCTPTKAALAKERHGGPTPLLPTNAVGVRSKNKSIQSDFDPMLLILSLERVHDGPIWVIKFSSDARYLATAGEDGKILVWEVTPMKKATSLEAPVEDQASEQVDDKQECDSEPQVHGCDLPLGTEVKLLSGQPFRVFNEHKADVIDLSWSTSEFILSASLDRTVRLWHITRPESFHVYQHADFVTSVDFHPSDDQYFLTGGFDKKLRVWSVGSGRVKEWAQTPDIITAARFTPNGGMVVAGLIRGQVYFYTAENLRYFTQLSCRNRHGSQRDGRKVTGLCFRKVAKEQKVNLFSDSVGIHKAATLSPSSKLATTTSRRKEGRCRDLGYSASPKLFRISPKTKGSRAFTFSEQLLVTTNDSRIRLYGLEDFCMAHKYKGTTNTCMQIKASFSESGDYILCGSEFGNVHVWSGAENNQSSPMKFIAHKKYDRSKPFASFQASQASLPMVTNTLFAPSRRVKMSLLASNLFPSLDGLDHINYDFSSAMVVTSDYDGTLRVFLKKSCLDSVVFAAGPAGSVHRKSS